MPTMNDIKDTQIFAIRNIITNHCKEVLTPAKVDIICKELESEMRYGNCSWAFNQGVITR